ncbi:MAG TPA: hypothetical protein VEJ23_00270 [Solirubrobacteraceae bacterium]|nr:hypothetical protein [Solirubrobacteraceae bacterium]
MSELVSDSAPAASEAAAVVDSNDEAIRAWDGPLYERFVRFRETITTGLGAHGEEALRLHAPAPGQRVLDIGCGFGDTTERSAGLVEFRVAGGELRAPASTWIVTARAPEQAAGA